MSGILDQTFDRARKVNQLIEEVAAAGTEQAKGIQQVNIAVSQMDQVTRSNVANSEEAASTAEELSTQANQMKDTVDALITIPAFPNLRRQQLGAIAGGWFHRRRFLAADRITPRGWASGNNILSLACRHACTAWTVTSGD